MLKKTSNLCYNNDWNEAGNSRSRLIRIKFGSG